MNISISKIKELHIPSRNAQQSKVENFISKLSQKLDEENNGLNINDLTGEIDIAANSLKGNERTEYLESAFSMMDVIEPFKTDPARQQILDHIKTLLTNQYFSSGPQINFTKDIHKDVVDLVQRKPENLKQELHKIHVNSNKIFKAKDKAITNLRSKMAEILMKNNDAKSQIKETLVSAVTLKDITELTQENWDKIMDLNNNTFRLADRAVIKCFPEVKTLEDYKGKITSLLENPHSLDKQEYSNLINLFVKTKGSHIDKLWFDLTCKSLKLSNSRVKYDQSHFFIENQSPSYIPDDGDCALHCIQYLLETRWSKTL